MRTYFEINGKGNITMRTIDSYIEQSKNFYKRDKAISVQVGVFIKLPNGITEQEKEDMLSGKIRPTGDQSEIISAIGKICNALVAVAYDSTAQIIGAIIYKYYAETPCIKVTIDSVREAKKSGTD